MLVWINGPFGAGKTQAAFELHRRLPGSFVCDPELLGAGIHRMTPRELRGDFQDVPIWREGVYQLLDHTMRHFPGVVITPMTVVSSAYFQDIVGRLRSNGHEVEHVILLASRETLLRRLRSRGEGPASWGARQIDRCLAGLSEFDAADRLHTDTLAHEAVVEEIARRARLQLAPDHSFSLQRALRRLTVQVKHIRWI